MTTAITQWVTRARTITAVGALAGALALPAPPARAFLGTTERVSVDSAGNQADGESSSPAISADGRFVAFVSFATNLVPSDSNGRGDVFVRDRLTQTTERVSVDSAGNEANRGSDGPSIS